jgi:myo-inositol-1(or 4)-monophosphatase
MTTDLAAVIEAALPIAEEAGRGLLAAWRRGATVTHKGEIDLVTEHDLASEKLIRERMRAAFPDHGLVCEEGGGAREGELVWYCDPLDGTTNFAHGHFFFSVSLGLARRGVPIAGVVHAPALGASWIGAEGIGATRIDRSGRSPARVSARASTLSSSLVGTGFPYDRRTSPENNVREFSRIVLGVQGVRRCGSAALDLCLVADGTYDAYWEQKLAPWDMCGGVAIARAAGARITDYDGSEVTIGRGRVVASNGLVHDELVREIAAARSA